MARGKLVKKFLYKGVTIFEYAGENGRGKYWMLQAGRSSHKYRTITGVKRAIDRNAGRKRR
jgi:hypothetical protein